MDTKKPQAGIMLKERVPISGFAVISCKRWHRPGFGPVHPV